MIFKGQVSKFQPFNVKPKAGVEGFRVSRIQCLRKRFAATLRTTLPFGMQALMTLRPKPTPRPPDTIQRNEPHFPKPGVTGGAQLAFNAGASPNPSDESNYFDGSTIQL